MEQHSNPQYVSEDGNDPTTALNVPLMRYAEVILIKAEAALMQAKNADSEINAIRERAGLLPISGATMTDLKRERRSELAGEFSKRHADLVRWGDAQEVYAQPLHQWDGALVPYADHTMACCISFRKFGLEYRDGPWPNWM